MHFRFEYLGSFYYYLAKQEEEEALMIKFKSLPPHEGANLSICDRAFAEP